MVWYVNMSTAVITVGLRACKLLRQITHVYDDDGLSCGIRSLRFLSGKEKTCDLANGRLSFTAVLSDLHSVLPHPSVSTLLSFARWLLGLRCANYNVASKHNGISEYHIPKLTSLLSPEHCSPYTLSNLICELLTNAIMNPTKQANGLLHNES